MTSLLPSDVKASIGAINGVSTGFKYGSSTLVSTSYVDIWPNASILSYQDHSERQNIVSTSNDDAIGGVGLQRLIIFGLDDDYVPIEEEILLDGTNNVLSKKAFLRVFRMRGIQSDNNGTALNVGTISVTSLESSTLQAVMAIGTNNSLQSQFTVPKNQYLVATSTDITVRSGDQANIRFFVRQFGECFTLRFEANIVSNVSPIRFAPPIVIPPKADITARAIKIAGGGNVGITVSYDYYLIDSSLVNLT